MGLGINFVLVILVFGKAPLGSVLETGLKTFEGHFASLGVRSYLHKMFVFDKTSVDEEATWNSRALNPAR